MHITHYTHIHVIWFAKSTTSAYRNQLNLSYSSGYANKTVLAMHAKVDGARIFKHKIIL